MTQRDAPNPSIASRRRLLKCMAWAGTGVLWTVSGGVPRTLGLIGDAAAAEAAAGELTFVQISDSHIGFHLPANPNPAGTLAESIAKIKAMPAQPAFLVHTGDISHLSKPQEWDTAVQLIGEANKPVYYIPGEHDVADADNGKAYLARFGKGTQGRGWYSFDVAGVHFIALINVFEFSPGFKSIGLAKLGDEQLEWLEKDLAGRSASTPLVVLAHLPLWTIYEPWGWGTADAGRALGSMKRFGSVTVLNGHIHQIVQKVEGNVTFHTAMGTAYPQPAPGAAEHPGPLQVPAGELEKFIGVRTVNYVGTASRAPVLMDRPLAAAPRAAAVEIRDMKYAPETLTIPAGTKVTWTNKDEMPHTVTERARRFASAALDTGESYSYTFAAPGEFSYFCAIHPSMAAKVIVKPGGSSA